MLMTNEEQEGKSKMLSKTITKLIWKFSGDFYAMRNFSVTNIDNFFLNLTFANLSNRFRGIEAIDFFVAKKRQKDKHAIREKRHIITANKRRCPY